MYSVNTDGSTLEIVKRYTPQSKVGIFSTQTNRLPVLIVGEAYAEHVALL